ncbi:putative Sacsin [Gigaspora margarita]|uniref:Putative Sacsin n=1 Tax=Gigaspora margarita TaxID=4874 RepID=A0A8H4ENU9_GIGMA|nr:putative Sacsin [Gigaspora margarita]
MSTLLSTADTKWCDNLTYVRDIIAPNMESIPLNLQDTYLKFLTEIFSEVDNINRVKDYLKDLKFVPNKHFNLFYARDLYDQCHQLFKFIYNDRFLQNRLQDNSKSLKVLEDIGLKKNVNEYLFIRCAKEIATKFEKSKENKDNLSNLRNIKNSAKKAVFYFYNHPELKFSESEWIELANIKFVPISKFKFGSNKFLNDLYTRYSHYGESSDNELECFKNICHPKYVSLAWTQLAFFEDEPPEENYWEEQKSSFPRGLRRLQIFLNSTDPFDSQSWVTATKLDLSLEKDFSLKRRAVVEHLTQYQNLLKLAGVNSPDIPIWNKPEPIEENSKIFFKSLTTNFYIQEFDDIDPDSFRILLRWLYGESLSQAIQNNGKKYDDGTFQVYQDFLIAYKKFNIESIKGLIEYKLVMYMNEDLINDNLEKVKELAEDYSLEDLLKYCEKIETIMSEENDKETESQEADIDGNNKNNVAKRRSILKSLKIR